MYNVLLVVLFSFSLPMGNILAQERGNWPAPRIPLGTAFAQPVGQIQTNIFHMEYGLTDSLTLTSSPLRLVSPAVDLGARYRLPWQPYGVVISPQLSVVYFNSSPNLWMNAQASRYFLDSKILVTLGLRNEIRFFQTADDHLDASHLLLVDGHLSYNLSQPTDLHIGFKHKMPYLGFSHQIFDWVDLGIFFVGSVPVIPIPYAMFSVRF